MVVPARNEDFLEIVVRRGQRTLGCCPTETFLESLLLEDSHLLQMEQRQLRLPVYNKNQGVRYNKRLNFTANYTNDKYALRHGACGGGGTIIVVACLSFPLVFLFDDTTTASSRVWFASR